MIGSADELAGFIVVKHPGDMKVKPFTPSTHSSEWLTTGKTVYVMARIISLDLLVKEGELANVTAGFRKANMKGFYRWQ